MRKCGLLGHPLSHSFSPEIHRFFGDYNYELIDLEEAEFEAFMKEKNFSAVNVTIPYKQKVIPYLNYIDESVRRIGACNCIVNRAGCLCGYNTDYAGLMYLINRACFHLDGAVVAVLGTGGTAKTSRVCAKALGAKEVFLVSRRITEESITYGSLQMYAEKIDYLINATPVGMSPKGQERPINLELFPNLKGVVDVIYNPLRTSLILQAKRLGIPAVGGLEMLVGQAFYASEVFQGTKLNPLLLDKAYREIRKKKQNIVLIGMPGSGKSTIGRKLAARNHKKFFDTDSLFVKERGPISEYMEEFGVEAFREREHNIVTSLEQEEGVVIATGGGVILREDNMLSLAHNGILVFLDRPLERLTPTKDRPLSSNWADLIKRYEERYPLYCAYADIHVKGSHSILQVVERIEKELDL